MKELCRYSKRRGFGECVVWVRFVAMLPLAHFCPHEAYKTQEQQTNKKTQSLMVFERKHNKNLKFIFK